MPAGLPFTTSLEYLLTADMSCFEAMVKDGDSIIIRQDIQEIAAQVLSKILPNLYI